MKKAFEEYLVKHGYKKVTESGNPSTVYSYCRGIDFVAREEGLDWDSLAEHIERIVPQYDTGGIKQPLGEKSRKTVINALKRFSEFLAVRAQGSLHSPGKGDGGHSPSVHAVSSPIRQQAGAREWPAWTLPTPDTILDMVKKVTPYIRFLHPHVVEAIVEDNERHRKAWRDKLEEHGVNPDFYLWERSCCAFPGIRRYSGRKEIASYHTKNGQELHDFPDALRLDDNSFPKHVWSFLFRGRPFQNVGPEGYALAHLADHKEYKNRRDKEFEMTGEAPEKLYGLYTSASNAVYMPSSLLRLTDFNSEIRLLLLNRAQQLYGGVCHLFPPALHVKATSLDWNISRFDWAEPEGGNAELDDFFAYRFHVMEAL